MMSLDLVRDGGNSYRHVLEDVGLGTFPRRVGNPGQSLAGSYASFVAWWEQNFGRGKPLFIGHSQIEPPAPGSALLYRTDTAKFVFQTCFGDFDTGDGQHLDPKEAQAEVQKVEAFLEVNGLEYAWKASGSMGRDGKDEGEACGFHLHVFFAQETCTREYLERWESAFWRGLKAELNIRSLNAKCSNPVCMVRLPFSPYSHRKDAASKDYKPEKNWCVPIPWAWVRDGQFDKIREASFYPGDLYNAVYGAGGPGTVRHLSGEKLPALESFVRRKGWAAFGHISFALHPELPYQPTGNMADLLKMFVPDRRCIQRLPLGANPRHVVRFALMCEFQNLGMGLEETIANIEAIGREAQWEDFNPTVIRSQVTNAFHARGGNGYKPMSCQKLREAGACLGASCSLFRDAFPIDWRDYVRNHPEVA